jgi:tRNA modification GTPase
MVQRDTIFALSSGRLPSAIAVVRVSGPRARFALETMAGRVPAPRQASLARLRDPQSGELLDEALALWFPGPRSETGEDTVELQLHGGRAVVAAVLVALGRLEGFRPAEAGEFTRRAFENGQLDLTAVEGLADLIGAETEAQRRQALGHLKGLLGDKAETWRTRLIAALALVEAGIDFSDEADVPRDLLRPALATAAALEAELGEALRQAARGERLREGLVVAIAGPPNAGKSTLLNRLARREAAIVSPLPGTTRDVIEVHFDLGGYPVTLLDTAGIRPTQDPIELEGVRRAQARAAAADLVLWLTDVSATADGGGAGPLAEPAGPVADMGQRPVWRIGTKLDMIDSAQKRSTAPVEHLVSAASGAGIDGLSEALAGFASRYFATGEPALVTRERQRALLGEAVEALQRAQTEGEGGREEVVAEELRLAARALGRLTGRVDVEDILDVIFRDFCIGK